MVVQFLNRPRVGPAVAVLAAGLLAVSLTTGSALGGFSAKLSNSANTVASGTVAISVTDSAGCASSQSTPGAVISCPGLLLPATVPASGSSTRTSAIRRTGLVDPTSASLQAVDCGPAMLADTGSLAGPALPRWATTFATTGPITGATALRLDGSTGYAESTSSENGAASTLQSFTIGTWFKSSNTSSGSGQGSLLAFEDVPTGSSATASDRILAMDAQGHLVFSVQTSPRYSVTTSRTYLDSAWHLAVATADAPRNTITVAVDGQQVSATNSKFSAAAATSPGYWKIGLSATGTGVGVPGYWPGWLADAFVLPTALTAGQVSSLSSKASIASQSAFTAAVSGYSPKHFWSLSDDGSSVFGGTVPALAGGSPCAQVAARASLVSSGITYCLVPATNCGTTWGTLGSGTAPIPPATATAGQSLALTMSRVASGFDTTDMPGLHVLLPVIVTETRGSFSTTLHWQYDAMVIQ